jgi:hypothetical protein
VPCLVVIDEYLLFRRYRLTTLVHQTLAIETTFAESRTHKGLETQCQWSDRTIERTTLCLFGLYSMVTLLAAAPHPDGKVPVQRAAWYPKFHATFAEVLAVVRRH